MPTDPFLLYPSANEHAGQRLQALAERYGAIPTLIQCLSTIQWAEQLNPSELELRDIHINIYSDFTAKSLEIPLKYYGLLYGIRLIVHFLPPYQFEAALLTVPPANRQSALFCLWDLAKMVKTAGSPEIDENLLVSRCQQMTASAVKQYSYCLTALIQPLQAIHYWPNELNGGRRLLEMVQKAEDIVAKEMSDLRERFMPFLPLMMQDGGGHLFSIGHYMQQDAPLTYNGASVIALQLVQGLAAEFGPQRKIIVLDGDNTLWGGILAESGAAALEYRAESYFGRLYALVLGQLRQLTQTGILLALISKNDKADVLSVLEDKTFPLSPKDFLSIQCGWEDKTLALQRLSEESGLALNHFVFIDDNHMEIMAIRKTLPDIYSVLVPINRNEYPQLLSSIPGIARQKVTEEDRLRLRDYQTHLQRKKLERKTANPADYLEQLKIKVSLVEFTQSHATRIAQLFERTTQFNFSMEKFAENELLNLHQQGAVIGAIEYTDIFSPPQIVGAFLGRIEAHKLSLSNMVLSCRVLGRQVEYHFLELLISKYNHINTFCFKYIKTNRNNPASIFLTKLSARNGLSLDICISREKLNQVIHEVLAKWSGSHH